jgi:hypothetical protein
MRIRLGELKRLVREARYPYADAYDEFYQRLRGLAYKQNGLKVTHESPAENFKDIWDQGLKLMDHGIYFTIGWHTKPQWITAGKGIIVHVKIPYPHVNDQMIVPDDRFGSGEEGCRALLDEYPGITGADIGTSFDEVPVRWIDNVLDAKGRSLVGRKL